ncbi:MAG: F0F1 ATP synthase subunit A [Pirellulales bacterium]|nr:F0F1 ATP synthase subunit A [Pirellulales bacterium]
MSSETGHHHDPLDPEHLFGHVQDAHHFELPHAIADEGKLHIWQPFEPFVDEVLLRADPDYHLAPFDLLVSKFMILEVIAAAVLIFFFIGLARKISDGSPARGKWSNMLESMLVFIRDEVARPAIGREDADRFLPFLWTMFFFVLICNLIGLVPWAGSATGALGTTFTLAMITFGVVLTAGMGRMGIIGFWKSLVPHMDLPLPLAIFLLPMIFIIEVAGLLIKHIVLAVRLLANMVAGHLVLAVLLAFILASSHHIAFIGVAPVAVAGASALTLLELLVAFLQAYIFTFLSALFIGTAIHPH